MAKEKLFTPEDFDKEPKAPKNNYIKWVVAAIIVIVVIVAMALGLKGCESNNQSQNVESQQPAIATVFDSIADSVVVIESDTADINVSQEFETSSDVVEVNDENPLSKTESEQVQNPVDNKNVSFDTEAEALKVIRGDYGNNPERKSHLGNKYQSIQNRVNELKNQGVF